MFLRDQDSITLALHIQNRQLEAACSRCSPSDNRQASDMAVSGLDTFMYTLSDAKVLESIYTGKQDTKKRRDCKVNLTDELE